MHDNPRRARQPPSKQACSNTHEQDVTTLAEVGEDVRGGASWDRSSHHLEQQQLGDGTGKPAGVAAEKAQGDGRNGGGSQGGKGEEEDQEAAALVLLQQLQGNTQKFRMIRRTPRYVFLCKGDCKGPRLFVHRSTPSSATAYKTELYS